MPVSSKLQLDEVFATCETIFKRDGYVSWAEVGKLYGVSRQAIHARLNKAVENGDLSKARMAQWTSQSGKIALSRVHEDQRRQSEKHTIRLTLYPENHAWLRQQCALRKASSGDIINGLITKAQLTN